MSETVASRERFDDTALIFMHLPKTGGTTLHHIIESHFLLSESYATSMTGKHPDGSLDGFMALEPAQRAKLKLLSGHMGFGLHEYLPRPAVYVAFLRDPVERVLSQFSFEHQEPQSYVYEQLRSGEMGLKEYLYYYEKAADMDNLQTRMIAGNWHKRGNGPCTEEMLETAKRNLREHFAVVGITEHFDESYLLCKRAFGWPYNFYIKRNRSRKRVRKAELSAEELAEIRRFNHYDLDLYDYAQELFAESVRAQGASFTVELKLFRAANRMYRTWWKARHSSPWMSLRQRLAAKVALE